MSSGRFLPVLAISMALAIGATLDATQSKAPIPLTIGDLNTAQLVEVRDHAGQVLLHGTFKTSKNEPKGTERKAELASPTGQRAKGKVEVEIERKDGVVDKEEIELDVERLPSATQCELFLDGKHVTSFMTSKDGRAELKLDRKPASGR